MFWKVRCMVAWTFSIIGTIVAASWLAVGIYLIIQEPVADVNGIRLGFSTCGIWLGMRLFGSLLSWTHPLDPLPRFSDQIW